MNDKKIKTCMVIGDPVEHSLSPKMHNAGYQALGIFEEFVYVAKRVSAEELKNFIPEVRASGIRGVSCTVPHKEAVLPFLDEIDETAKKIGAVNTIVNTNGVLKGYNTDYLGISQPLEKITSLENKNVLVLGAGGAARSACFALSQKKANVFVYNRTKEKAEALAKDFNAKVMESLDLKEIAIVINATSVGLSDNETPLPKEMITKDMIVFDLVYSADRKTRLLQEAEAQGATIISGKEMLLYQGLEQFKLFTGHDAPIDAMRKALE